MGMDWEKRIKELRHFEGLKQDALALQLGVSQASVSQWERGVTEPPAQIQAALQARFASTPVSQFKRALCLSVRMSPNIACLLSMRNGDAILNVISRSTLKLTTLIGEDDVNKPIRGKFGAETDSQLDRLIKAGLFEARVESAMTVSLLERGAHRLPIYCSLTSFKVEHGEVVVRAEVRLPYDADTDAAAVRPSVKIVRERLCDEIWQ